MAGAAAAAAGISAWHARGSIAAPDWLPAAVIVGALLVTVLAAGAAVRPSRWALVSLGALTALAAWTGLSLAWTPLPSLARDEVLLTVLYALVLALPLVSLRADGERLAAVAAVGAAAVAIGLVAAVELLRDGSAVYFAIGRLEFPITYANTEAAVLLVGLWPCLAVAATRAAPLLLRGAATGGAALLLGGWLATQSKGGGIGLVVSTLAVFALSPDRLRLAVPTLLAAAAAAAAVVPLTEPYRAEDDVLQAASEDAGRALLLVAAAAALAGLVYALADRRIVLRARGLRVARTAAGIALVAGVALAAGLALATFGRPDRALVDGWESFSSYYDDDSSRSHLVSLGGSNRYDFWRVSLLGARDHPVVGIGARGFQAEYLREGQSFETPARAHSLPLEALLELGAVGLILLLLAVLPALVLAVLAVRRGRLWAVAAFGGAVGFLAHASVDWTWTFPAAGIPFFLLLGIGASAGGVRLLPRSLAAGGAAAAALATLLLFVPAWLSARFVDRAAEGAPSAAADLRLARRLDPVTVRPLLVEHHLTGSLDPLAEAARREPDSVGVRYLYGIRLLDAGRKEDARRELRAAERLAPGQDLIDEALERAG